MTIKFSLFLFIIFGLLTACHRDKNNIKTKKSTDSIEANAQHSFTKDKDTVVQSSLPLSADGLFDDFIYDFMRSRKRQLERTRFPLLTTDKGRETYISKEEWKHDYIFSKMEMLCLLFQDEKSIVLGKDTSVQQAIIEMLDIKTEIVKQYTFQKQSGLWFLIRIDQHTIGNNVNSDFYHFYKLFSTNPDFQKKHIINPFVFKTFDSDNFNTIEGTLDIVQWPDYAPHFPKEKVATINYGQQLSNQNSRVLVLNGLSNGMNCTLVFKKINGKWMMTKFSN